MKNIVIIGLCALLSSYGIEAANAPALHPRQIDLYNAVRYGHAAVVHFLLTNGTNPSFRTPNGSTLLHSTDRRDILEHLLHHHAPVDATNPEGYTPLYWAITRGNYHLAELFLRHNANVNIITDGYALLHIAILRGDVALTELLLRHGVNSAIPVEYSGATALHLATEHHDPHLALALVALLLRHGAQVTAMDREGETPLHYATRINRVDIARLLVAKTAAAQNKKGRLEK